MEKIYLGIIVGLIVLFIFLFYNRKKHEEKYTTQLEQSRKEASASLVGEVEKHELEIGRTRHLAKEKQEALIRELNKSHSEEKKKMNKHISNLEKYSRNRGEIITHKILSELKNSLVTSGKLTSEEMIIMGNVFIPYTSRDSELKSRQLDHLVLLPTGIYVIETKYWRGKILHGLTKKRAKEFSFILDSLFPKSSNDTEETIVFLDDRPQGDSGNYRSEMRAVYYDNPAKQVKASAWALNGILKKKYNNPFVTPILYFGYEQDNVNNVTDYSEEDLPYRFSAKEELCNFLESQIDSGAAKFNSIELNNIKTLIDDLNYFE